MQVFNVTNPEYHDLTLEVLATFEKAWEHVTWNRVDAIRFQLRGRPYRMSNTEFFLSMGLYYEDYTRTLEYHNLHFHRQSGEPQK